MCPRDDLPTHGEGAAGHLERYQPPISSNFEIPIHLGRLIAQWDEPAFVPAAEAVFLRPDDYVVGLTHRDRSVAFPLWITDYYHVVNCELGGDPVVFTTCERCQSGSAFVSAVDDRTVKFSAMGMYNASLTMVDRFNALQRSGSIWLHYEGVAVHGAFEGRFLEQIPTYHATWEEWLRLHSDTAVMSVPDNPRHRDARDGHGREETFSRPGMDPPLIQTITGDLDGRFPENEMVLGLNYDRDVGAWPLREVQRSGGVVNQQFAEHPIVVMAGPAPHQFTMAAYSRRTRAGTLTFRNAGDHYVDHQTGSAWTIEGEAVAGDLLGCRLAPLRWQYVRWHAWFYPHRTTALYRHPDRSAVWPGRPAGLDPEPFEPLLEELGGRGAELRIEGAVVELALPHEAELGLVVRLGDERLNLYSFVDADAAHDYVVLQGAYFCPPIAVRLGRKPSVQLGRLVVESDPEIQYEGPSQFVRLPDPEIRWSRLVTGSLFAEERAELSGAPRFTGLFRHLRRHGFDVVECAFVPRSQLRVGVGCAVAATINADRFVIYRCDSPSDAATVGAETGRALVFDRWVIRSTPAIMFEDPRYEMGELTDDEIRWSGLLEQERFARALREYLGAPSSERRESA